MWFTDGIKQALNKSKNDKLMLFIYIEGKDDVSKEMTSYLESNQNLKDLLKDYLIALKLEEDSENSKMFGQIYQIVTVPSVYLINCDGVLLEKIFDSNKNELIEKIKTILDFDKKKKENNNVVLLDDHNIELGSNKTSNNESNDKDFVNIDPKKSQLNEKEEKYEKKIENSIDEQKKKSKDLMEKVNKTRSEIREKQQREEEKKKRQDEVERIKIGKSLQKLKQLKKDQEYKELISEKEKRKRIIAQIKADHEERKERNEREKLIRQLEEEKRQASMTSCSLRNFVVKEDEIKIQFRLPDNTVLINKFKIHDPFLSAVNYIQANSQFQNFVLTTTYPKRNFEEHEYSISFKELGLINSAVFLVIISSNNVKNKVVENSIFTKIWFFLFEILNSFLSLFKSSSNRTNADYNSQVKEPFEKSEKVEKDKKQNFDRDGNLFKFKNLQDHDDDDNNTWNGNSTQQQ